MRMLKRTTIFAAMAAVPLMLGFGYEGQSDGHGNSGHSSILAQEAPSNPDADRMKTQFESRLKRYAGDHEGLGKKYQRAGDIPEAIKQYRFAIYLDTDHAQARKAMGYVQRDGRWFVGSLLTPDPEVDVSKLTGEEKKKHEEKQKSIEAASAKVAADVTKHAARAAKDLIDWHGKLTKIGANDAAAKALLLAGWYMPDDADVAKARGFVMHRAVLRHPKVAVQIDRAREAFDAAPRGTPLDGEDPQAGPLKVGKIYRTKQAGRNFVARTTHSDARAGRLLQVTLATDALTKRILGSEKETVFRQGDFHMTEFQSKQEFTDFIYKYDTSDERRKEFLLKLSGTGSSDPFGFVTWHNNSMSGDDMASHNVAVSVLNNHRSRSTSNWVARGFGYMITGQMLGTTATRFYTLGTPRGRTAVRGDGGEPVFRRERSGPDRMRQLCVEMIILDDDLTFHEISKVAVNDMTERHVSKAFSLMEFLVATRETEFRKWLMETKGSPDDELKQLLESIGMDEAGLQSAWSEWVLSHY